MGLPAFVQFLFKVGALISTEDSFPFEAESAEEAPIEGKLPKAAEGCGELEGVETAGAGAG